MSIIYGLRKKNGHMKISVRKRHIILGQPRAGKDPLSLAFQDALDLPEHCIRLTPSTITLLDYNGSTRYSRAMPEDGANFLIKYYDYAIYGQKKPSPFVLVVEPVDYIIDKVDILRETAIDIEDWSGSRWIKY